MQDNQGAKGRRPKSAIPSFWAIRQCLQAHAFSNLGAENREPMQNSSWHWKT